MLSSISCAFGQTYFMMSCGWTTLTPFCKLQILSTINCILGVQSYPLPFPHDWTFSSVQLLSCVWLFATPWTTARQRPPCPSPTPRVHPNPCPLSQWCHPTISSSVVPFSSCPHSFPASGFFPMSQLFTSGGQSFGVLALTSVLPMNTQDWSPLGWTGWAMPSSQIN